MLPTKTWCGFSTGTLLKSSTPGPIKSIKNQTPTSNLKTQKLNLKSNSRENTKADTIKLNLVPTACHSLSFIKWKRKHGISAHVHNVQNPAAATSLLPEDILPIQNESIDLQPLSYAHIAVSAVAEGAHMLVSNNEDILTQSQMLKTSDKEHFITSQKGEIEGLLKFDVMDIHPIASLPRSAKLLSSIWSYRRKRSPNGDLLNHKSRICVNGKEQSFGRDYWETYAPVASWATIRM